MANEIIKVGIVGSRSRNSSRDKNLIKQVLLRQIKKGRKLHLVSGGCWQGADKFAEELAKELNLGISIHKVDTSNIEGDIPKWMYAKLAYERNTFIAEECDILITTWDGKSRGTADTMAKVENMKKKIICL